MLIDIRHFHLFCGLGGGAAGFNRGQARVGSLTARFRCLGGIDSDPAAVRDFSRLAGVPGTCLDLFDRDQYHDWHGQEPPADWREATPEDLRRAAGHEAPDILFTSPPCKGFSGLLSERLSTSARYAALNRLTLRGLWLALEAWADDPPAFILLENVPRIASRGAHLLDQIQDLLGRYGYASARTTHDCGTLGGLSQTRRRFLLVARNLGKVPPHLYEPPYRPLRSVGDTLGRWPLPDAPEAGPMHALPALQWRTWVRLAFVEAGGDWRSLARLRIQDGVLADYLIVPAMWRGGLGVCAWGQAAGTLTADARPSKGAFAVADPRRPEGRAEFGQYGVLRWDETSQTVTGKAAVGAGRFAVSDPRCNWSPNAHRNKLALIPWDGTAATVTGSRGAYSGALSVADPRCGIRAESHSAAGCYGVVSWDDPAGTVIGSARHDNGRFNVADPRIPDPGEPLRCCIVAEDGTWHRPFTTLELAALQGLSDPDQPLVLDGGSHGRWRERIGNAVPPPAAAAIASEIGRTLLLAHAGESFALSDTPVWVRPIATACAVRQRCDDIS
ncbi:DNA cytosine methyltransferase [Imhoffiella purpurea]|uniref:DNA (cytosine-5-)-methyltransferase n=1 Tax=Imhoffiella purpurea TaxID=1249627 RepID=W9V9N2_9GAMM|nr:DNA cytosine methyltransferase [Imhoffiella purpurea]EXJ13596.1 C-5 cytosine-specific DNA methylase [Imhoffiella purpurea]